PIRRGVDRVHLAVEHGCPVRQHPRAQAVGQQERAGNGRGAGSGTRRTCGGEAAADEHGVAHDLLIPDHAVDLGRRQRGARHGRRDRGARGCRVVVVRALFDGYHDRRGENDRDAGGDRAPRARRSVCRGGSAVVAHATSLSVRGARTGQGEEAARPAEIVRRHRPLAIAPASECSLPGTRYGVAPANTSGATSTAWSTVMSTRPRESGGIANTKTPDAVPPAATEVARGTAPGS